MWQLPGGYVDDGGALHREVELTPLSGREEELLAERTNRGGAGLVTAILSRCVCRLGAISPVKAAVARRLLVADRQYLLLKLRQVTFGDQVQATILCPWSGCGQRVDIDFSLQDVPIRESPQQAALYPFELSPEAAYQDARGEVYRTVSCRLPNGEDQEAVSPLAADDEARASLRLLGRCIQSIGPWRQPGEDLVSRLSPLARTEIERGMEALAPKIDSTLEVQCCECGRAFAVPFDLQALFFSELRTSRELLYREVHYLAYHYHWSEHEIMAMPRDKRRRYIEVLTDEIHRLNYAV